MQTMFAIITNMKYLSLLFVFHFKTIQNKIALEIHKIRILFNIMLCRIYIKYTELY